MKKFEYSGIDYFRLLAAFLIVAIHTSPLMNISPTGDFILTRVIARTAVPFFFMTSGFFLISNYGCYDSKLSGFAKKTAKIYLVAILIYIPVNIYTGYFKADNLLPNIIKDIVFDGTMYHLWYLPASIIGAVIAWYAVKGNSYIKAFTITGLLYLVGLFGDSYYGLVESMPAINGFYELIFQVTDYTRNGVFFAPVFFVMGAYIADDRKESSALKCAVGFVLCLALMLCEALVLRKFGVQRHDSMYIFLVPCMYFLLALLLKIGGRRNAHLRDLSLVIYIIHPLMIIAVRMVSKPLNLQRYLVENNLIHFVLVCLLSAAVAWCYIVLRDKIRRKASKPHYGFGRAEIEFDMNNLEHNVRELQRALPPKCELMAVLKANAYGHGACQAAEALSRLGVNAYAVACISEAIQLRNHGIRGDILILGYTSPSYAYALHKYDLTQTLIDYDYFKRLDAQGYKVKAHLKIDSGMHRLGFDPNDVDSIAEVFAADNIKLTGIFTHLSCADSLEKDDVDFSHKQIECFENVVKELENRGLELPKIHIQSSYAFLNYPELKCDYIRAGVILFGFYSSPNDTVKLNVDLRPVLSLKSQIVLLRDIKCGDSVGYGRAFTAKRDSRIAILPIGYADGYPRSLSGENGYVLIHGKKVPVIGRICMDQLTVDVTDIPNVKVGDKATLIGIDEFGEINAAEVAESTGSITNELLSRMGRRLTLSTKYRWTK